MDPQFRKKLRQCFQFIFIHFLASNTIIGKEKKRVDRSNASLKASADAAASEKQLPTDAELDAALQVVRSEDLPETPEEKEQYFMQNLALGEQLSAQGMHLARSWRSIQETLLTVFFPRPRTSRCSLLLPSNASVSGTSTTRCHSREDPAR